MFPPSFLFFFFNDTATTEIYTLSLHDALPICGAMSKLFGGGQKAASGGIQGDVLATDNNTVGMGSKHNTLNRSEERFSRNAETDLVCRLLLEKKKEREITNRYRLNTY